MSIIIIIWEIKKVVDDAIDNGKRIVDNVSSNLALGIIGGYTAKAMITSIQNIHIIPRTAAVATITVTIAIQSALALDLAKSKTKNRDVDVKDIILNDSTFSDNSTTYSNSIPKSDSIPSSDSKSNSVPNPDF